MIRSNCQSCSAKQDESAFIVCLCGKSLISKTQRDNSMVVSEKKYNYHVHSTVLSALSVVENETYRFRLNAREIIANTSFSSERKNLQNSKLYFEFLTEMKKEKPQRLKKEIKKTKHLNGKLENRLN